MERSEMSEVIKNIDIDFEQSVKEMLLRRLLKVRAINKSTYTKATKQLRTKEE